jgi:hypothetical protein
MMKTAPHPRYGTLLFRHSISEPLGRNRQDDLCLLNRKKLLDPITGDDVGLGMPTGEDHHILPTRFVQVLDGWVGKRHTANVILNIMRVSKEANAEFLNSDPRDQVTKAKTGHTKKQLRELYGTQAINESCLAILEQSSKTLAQFTEFLCTREAELQGDIRDEFGFPVGTQQTDEQEEE